MVCSHIVVFKQNIVIISRSVFKKATYHIKENAGLVFAVFCVNGIYCAGKFAECCAGANSEKVTDSHNNLFCILVVSKLRLI